MKMPWGYKVTSERVEGGQLVLNVKMSALRLAAEITRAVRPRYVPLMLALLAVAVIRSHARAMLAVMVGALGIALLTGCAASPPNVQAIPPYVVEREGYGSCAETGGKIEVPRAGVVALLTSVCWMRTDSGLVAIDASAEPAIDPKDSGTAGEDE